MNALTPLGDADLVGFVAAHDLTVAQGFYGDMLGFELVHSSEFANVYDANGTQLWVTRVKEPTVAPYTVLGWQVQDVAAKVTALRERGVVFNRYDGVEQDEFDVWAAPSGSRIAWFSDPDGNTLSLQQAG